MRRFLVVGTGRAGQARLRSLAARSDIEGIALSARNADFDLTFEEYLSDPSIEAVLVCTQNSSHFEIALRALTACKHVLVEFPLTHDHNDAIQLYETANDNKRVLHVEFIGLMTASHLAYHASDSQSWHRVKVIMEGDLYRWVETEYESNRVGGLMNGRLQALHHLLGSLELKNTRIEHFTDGYSVSVQLSDQNGTQIEVNDTRRVGLKRVRKMKIYERDETLIEPGETGRSVSLFAADLDVFCRKIQREDTQWSLPDESDIIEVIRLSEAISHQCVSTFGENTLHSS